MKEAVLSRVTMDRMDLTQISQSRMIAADEGPDSPVPISPVLLR